MEPLAPIVTLCRIILRAREYEAQVATDYDCNEAADNVDDGQNEILSVLDDAINTVIGYMAIYTFCTASASV